ncbi:hypothetical protein ISO66_05205 [Morganella morganii subsp. morganii]|nr:hypothetical protein [Morganella morganii]MBT0332745.1 hypothetical protein [Morganella morganii subsp. morganii]
MHRRLRAKSLPCQNLRQRQTIVAEFSAVGIKAGRRSDRGDIGGQTFNKM